MEKIKEIQVYDMMNKKDKEEYKNKYKTDYGTGIVFIGEEGNHYVSLSTDVIQPVLKVNID